MIDISHESLMRVWQRLNTWADEEAQSAPDVPPPGRRRQLCTRQARQACGATRTCNWRSIGATRASRMRPGPRATAPGFDDARAFLRDSEAATRAAELEKERQQAEAERIAKERELEQAKSAGGKRNDSARSRLVIRCSDGVQCLRASLRSTCGGTRAAELGDRTPLTLEIRLAQAETADSQAEKEAKGLREVAERKRRRAGAPQDR